MSASSPLVRTLADNEGATALGVAAMNGQARIVNALDPDKRNWRGNTPRDFAQREGFLQLFSDVERVSGATSELMAAAESAKSAVFRAGDMDEELGPLQKVNAQV